MGARHFGVRAPDFEELSGHMSYSLNSFKGVVWGIIYGTTKGVLKGDARRVRL